MQTSSAEQPPKGGALPADFLTRLYAHSPRRLRYKAARHGDFAAWTARVRARLQKLLGPQPDEGETPRAETVARDTADGVTREKIVIRDEAFGDVPAYLLAPAALASPAPGVLCLHGHGGYYAGKDMVAAVADTHPIARECGEALNYAYGLQLAKAGFVTVCPDAFGFGERMFAADRWAQDHICSRYLATLAPYGLSPLGLTVRGYRLAVSHLLSRPDVRGPLVGCVGLSFGGSTAIVTTCLDTRIGAAVISGALSSRALTAAGGTAGSCGAQEIPGMLEWFDMPDLAAAIAPRPALYEMMKQDRCFAFDASMAIYRHLESVYAAAGAAPMIECDTADTDHRYIGNKTAAFFRRHLPR